MTRMGKSNTAKTIIARTFVVSDGSAPPGRRPIGQLIFDPQGEYANPNTQDGTEIAAIGAEPRADLQVRGRRLAPHVKPLGINFFDPSTRSTQSRA